MNKLATLLKLVLAVGGLTYLATQGNLRLNWAELDSRAWTFLAAGTVTLVAACVVGFFRWWVLVRGNGVSFRTIWQLSWASCFVNTCLPGGVGGDILRGVLLGGKFTRSQGLASVAADRGIAIVALVVLNGVFLIADPATLNSAAHYRWAAGFFVVVAILLTAVAWVGPRWSRRLKNLLAPWRGQGRRWGWAFGLATLGHLLTSVGLILYLEALPGARPELGRFLSHVPLALALAGIPALPGGLGIGHLAFAGILGLSGAVRAADLYTLYALHLFLIAAVGVVPFLSLRIPFKQILRYNHSR